MKTVPSIGVADSADAVVSPDLPEEIALEMSVIDRGLLAMSTAIFEAEITEVGGPRSKTLRWGTGQPTRSAAEDQNH